MKKTLALAILTLTILLGTAGIKLGAFVTEQFETAKNRNGGVMGTLYDPAK